MTIVSENPVTTDVVGEDGTVSCILPGLPWLSLTVAGGTGVLTVGTARIQVQVTSPGGGSPVMIDAVPDGLSLAALSVAAGSAGGADPLAALPPALADAVGSIGISRVSVTADVSARVLLSAELTVTADRPWTIVPGHVVVDGLRLTVRFERAGDSFTVAVTGAASVAGVSAEIGVRRDEQGVFTVTVTGPDGAALEVPTFAQIGELLGVQADQLPDAFPQAGLTVPDLAIVIRAAAVEAVHVTVRAAGWTLPLPIGVTVEAPQLTIGVAHPADAATRAVTVSAQGRVVFAGAAVAVRLARGADGWTLHGELETGSALTISGVAGAFGGALPAQLPDFGLASFALDAVLGAGECTVTAASDLNWSIAVGPAGIGVSGLSARLSRHAADADGRTVSGWVRGTVHLGGADIPVEYSWPGGLTLTGELPRFAPFEVLRDLCGAAAVDALSLPPEVLALALTELRLTIDVDRAEAEFSATGPGFRRVQAVVRKGTSWGFAVGIALDDGYRFSSLSAALGGLDAVKLPDALIVISTFDDTGFTFDELQPVAGTGVSRGLLVDGRLDLSGLGADRFLGRGHLDVTAHVGAGLSELALDAGVGDIVITDGVVLKNAEFELVPDPENVSVSVSGAVDVTIDSNPLEFIGGVRVVPNGISFFATMKGTWADPFGAKGIALSDVSLEIGSDFEGVPSIGITGGLRIGGFAGKAAVSFNSEFPTQSVLIVAFNHLSLLDVVGTFCPPAVTAGIPADVGRTLAGMSLDDVELSVVPQDTSIGKITFKQGLRVGGTLNVAGFRATSMVEIDPARGIAATGSLSPIVVDDVFALTGAAGDGAGPSVDVQLHADAVPRIAFSGRVALLGLSAGADVALSDSGFVFHCAGRVFDAFDAAVTATGGSIGSSDGFTVHAQMSQTFLADLAGRVADTLRDAGTAAAGQIAAAEKDVADAQAQVDRVHAAVASARSTLQAAQADAQRSIATASAQVSQAQNSLSVIDTQITSTRATIQAERNAAAQRINDAQAAVNQAQGPVNDLTGQISALQSQIDQLNADIAWWNNWYNNLSTVKKAVSWARLAAEVGWRGTKVAGLTTARATLQASLATANGVLQAARQTLQAAQAAAVTYPIDQDPRILSLQTGRAAAQLALQGAQAGLSAAQHAADLAIAGAQQALTTAEQQSATAERVVATTGAALDALRRGVSEVAQIAGYVAEHGLRALLDVRSASFDGSLTASSGGSVTLDADVVFQGSPQTVHVFYDFHDLVAGAKAVAKALVPGLPD
jgi:hypothetical protein